MTHIEQMIKDFCPNGVEWKTLGELGVLENTGVDKKCRDDEDEVTLLNFMDVCRHKYIDASVPSMVVTAPERKITQCNVLKDDIFITPSSETIDEIGFAAVIMEDLPNVVYSYHIMRYRLNNPSTTTAKFIRYLFEAPIIRKQILKGAKGLTRFGLSKYQFSELEIPLPSLEIQKKIVECLDKFSALAAELQAELQGRRKQYEYYRTHLLTPTLDCNSADNNDGCNWEWKTLGEVCDVYTGGETPKDAIKGKEPQGDYIYPIYSNGVEENALYGFSKDYVIEQQAVTFSSIGTIGHPTLRNGKFTPIIRLKVIIPKDEKVLNISFLKYALEIARFSNNKSSVPNINANMLKQISIPIPPLAEQQRIANTLERFEKLITSMEEGIPAEQIAQQKRYEYYRDKLLTFPKP